MGVMSKNETEQRFKDLLASLNSLLAQSVKNVSGSEQTFYTNVKSYEGVTQPTRYSYGFGSLNKTVVASITYEEFIKTTNYGILVPYLMAIGQPVVSDAVKTPQKYNVIEPELLQTTELLDKIRTRTNTMKQTNTITCRTQCFGGCSGNCFHACKGSCATNCANTCGEKCSDMCYASCTGRCNTTCNSECITTCTGTCETTCRGCGGCTGKCQGCNGCSGCSGTCAGSCTGGCGGSCTGGCGGGCSSSCRNSCSGCAGSSKTYG